MQEDTSDYYLIRKIKLAVYRITDIGDQIEISMVNEPKKVIFYKILSNAPLTEIEKVKRTIEDEAKMIGIEAVQDRN